MSIIILIILSICYMIFSVLHLPSLVPLSAFQIWMTLTIALQIQFQMADNLNAAKTRSCHWRILRDWISDVAKVIPELATVQHLAPDVPV